MTRNQNLVSFEQDGDELVLRVRPNGLASQVIASEVQKLVSSCDEEQISFESPKTNTKKFSYSGTESIDALLATSQFGNPNVNVSVVLGFASLAIFLAWAVLMLAG